MNPRKPAAQSRTRPWNEKEERFYVPMELSKKLDAIAATRNLSKSEYVRQIVVRQLRIDLADARHGIAPPSELVRLAVSEFIKYQPTREEFEAELQRFEVTRRKTSKDEQ